MLHLLLDEGVSREIKRELVARGYDVEHVLDLGLKAQPDPVIFLVAQQRQSALYTLIRTHFELLADAWVSWGHGPHAGIILPSRGQPSPAAILQALGRLLQHAPQVTGRVVYL